MFNGKKISANTNKRKPNSPEFVELNLELSLLKETRGGAGGGASMAPGVGEGVPMAPGVGGGAPISPDTPSETPDTPLS